MSTEPPNEQGVTAESATVATHDRRRGTETPSEICRGRTSWRRLLVALVIWVGIGTLYVVLVTLLSEPRTLSIVTVTTERVEVRSTAPALSALPLSGMRRIDLAGQDECLEGALVPEAGATLAIERSRAGTLAVILEAGTAVYRPAIGGRAVSLRGPIDIVEDRTCGPSPPSRFPLWGELRFSREFGALAETGDVRPDLLISGRLVIQAEAIEEFRQVFGRRMRVPFAREAIYTVAEVDLPVGARIEALPDPRGQVPAWWGAALPRDDGFGLEVHAASEARQLAIYRPQRAGPSVISVSGLTQLFSDPNIIRIQVMILALGGIGSLVAAVMRLGRPD